MAIVNPNSAGPLATKPEELSLKNKIKQDLTNKGISSLGSYKPTQADVNEFKTTGSFSKSFYDNAKNQTIATNEQKIFGNEAIDPGSSGALPEIKTPETPTTQKGIITPSVIGQKTETKTPETQTGTPSTTTPGETPFPKIQADVLDINKDFVLGADELTGAEKDVYNMMTDTEKEQFAAIGDMAKKNGQDYAKAQAEYLQKWKANKEYLQGVQDKKTQINQLSGEIQDIQSSERIQAAQNQLDNLKQTVSYLGSMGRPGTSATRFDAVAKQIQTAETTFSNLKKIEANYSQMRQLGEDIDTEAFEKQMKDLQDDLDGKVNTAIQDAFNAVSSADMAGKLDSVEEIENLRMQLMANLDTQITGITDANIEQRNFLIDRYDKIAENKLKFIQNKNSINMDMSKVQGFYVDGNGNPVISATTGKPIDIPKSAPLDPVFNKDNGTLITFDYDENGNIVGNVDQVIPKQTFEQSTIANYAKLVADGKIKIDDVPADVRSTSGFVDALVSTPVRAEEMTPYQKAQIELEKQKLGLKTETGTTELSGALATEKINGKNVTMDTNALASFKNAIANMPGTIIGAQQYRTKEEQKALYDAGKSWTLDSKHMKGLAVDIYSGTGKKGELLAPTKEQVAIMNANGWYQDPNLPNDKGHFEYKGVSGQKTYTENDFKYLDQLTDSERGKVLDKDVNLRQAYKDYLGTQLNDKQKARVDKYVLDFENQPEVKDYSIIKSQLEGAREYAKKSGSNTDDQALIYTFAKVMDPGSVVRESEYATVQDYSQDLLGRYAGKIGRIYSTDGFLTQDAKDKMLKTLETKLKSSEAVMKNIRDEKVKQINKITGGNDGDTYLTDFAGTTNQSNQKQYKISNQVKSEWDSFISSKIKK